ncbi:MAG: DUF3332 domain-containing protein [Bacteroidetes bacterium]|nr:DUF3332 domain-containing protein [Bacteroidota bacterium]
MKTIKQTTLIFLIAIFGLTQMGCFGKFALVSKLYSWNKSLGDKFVRSAVLWVFLIIPVYEVASLVDFLILNLIEFWSGSNPVAMKPGEKETQMLAWHGDQYRVTATQNRFHIEQLTGKSKGKVAELVFNTADKSWNAVSNERTTKLVSFSETKDRKELVTFYKPDGTTTTVLASESIASIQQKLSTAYARK